MAQYLVRLVTPLTIQEYDDAILVDLKKTGNRYCVLLLTKKLFRS